MVQRYAPDTNFFLQFKKPQELRWGEITAADSIELVVLTEVLDELDNHKNGGNERRARRARDTLRDLRPLILEGQGEVLIRDAKPRVVYRLAPLLPSGRAKPEQLDMDKADARIVEEALACGAGYEGGLALLTHDAYPLRLAAAVGLARQALPDEWRLPPEPDAKDKKLRDLEQALEKWERRSPAIHIELRSGGAAVHEITRAIGRYSEPPDELLDRLLDRIVFVHPEQSTSVAGSITVYRQSEIEGYQRRRREWLQSLRDRMVLHAKLAGFRKGIVPIELELTNTGGATAEQLAVELQAEGDVALVRMKTLNDFEDKQLSDWADPPPLKTLAEIAITEPTFDFTGPTVPSMRGLHGMQGVHGRDFYWEFDEPEIQSKRLTGACGDFRHGIHREVVAFGIVAPWNGNATGKGRLVLSYSAKNLPEPVKISWPIDLQQNEADVGEELERLVDKWLRGVR